MMMMDKSSPSTNNNNRTNNNNNNNVHIRYVVLFIAFIWYFRSFLIDFISIQMFMKQIQLQKCLYYDPTSTTTDDTTSSCQLLYRRNLEQKQQVTPLQRGAETRQQTTTGSLFHNNASVVELQNSSNLIPLVPKKQKKRRHNNNNNSSLVVIKVQNNSSSILKIPLPKQQQTRRRHKNKLVKGNIVFLHVGKTGGATIARLLRKGCHHQRCFNERKKKNGIQNETQISLLTTHYFHCNKRPGPRIHATTNTYLISLRNPITRFLSWFIQFNPFNTATGYVTERSSDELKSFIPTCFSNNQSSLSTLIDDFVTYGLSKNESMIGWGSKPWIFDLHGMNYSCSQYARELVQGERSWKEINHMFWNIQFYINNTIFNRIPPTSEEVRRQQQPWIEYDPTDKNVLVIRQEQMWDDWQDVNYLVGGGKIVIPKVSVLHLEGIDSKEMLPVHNRTMSRYGLQYNLCCALKDEIHAYQETLNRALNINETEKERSMNEIYSMCNVVDQIQLFDRCKTY